jgi:hypothetical protein
MCPNPNAGWNADAESAALASPAVSRHPPFDEPAGEAGRRHVDILPAVPILDQRRVLRMSDNRSDTQTLRSVASPTARSVNRD